MQESTLNTERQFIDDLTARLNEATNWKVGRELRMQEDIVDLVVEDSHSGKRIYIEFKGAGQYGQLPIASILSLNKQKSRLLPTDNLLLVTFSGIPELLANKLNELGIMTITKPKSIDDVVGKVQLAMAS
jgi:hypothetical protein